MWKFSGLGYMELLHGVKWKHTFPNTSLIQLWFQKGYTRGRETGGKSRGGKGHVN